MIFAVYASKQTDRFRRDNTEGYDAADLTELNAAWDRLAISAHDSGDIVVASMQDHLSETLLSRFDAGARGEALTHNMILR
jgi:hypothetical protein